MSVIMLSNIRVDVPESRLDYQLGEADNCLRAPDPMGPKIPSFSGAVGLW